MFLELAQGIAGQGIDPEENARVFVGGEAGGQEFANRLWADFFFVRGDEIGRNGVSPFGRGCALNFLVRWRTFSSM